MVVCKPLYKIESAFEIPHLSIFILVLSDLNRQHLRKAFLPVQKKTVSWMGGIVQFQPDQFTALIRSRSDRSIILSLRYKKLKGIPSKLKQTFQYPSAITIRFLVASTKCKMIQPCGYLEE